MAGWEELVDDSDDSASRYLGSRFLEICGMLRVLSDVQILLLFPIWEYL